MLLAPAGAADDPPQAAGDAQPRWPHCRWLTYDATTDPPTYTVNLDCLFPLPAPLLP